jgi:beta-barrel assembly-enhancing protease
MNIKTIILATLLLANSAFAGNGTLSGKPYVSPTNLDTSLPDLGDVSQTVLTPLDEQYIGDQIMREVAASDEVLQDIEVIDYLNALGNKLAAASPDKQQKFSFFVVQDNSINAFAMPGGVIGVHTGLILANNSESELASVLGHEIGHVTQRHLARMLAKQKTDMFKNIAGIALALLVSRANPELATGALTTASAAGVQRQLDYTREHEREADRVGLSILDNAGFDARAMPAFFTTLQRGTRFTDGAAPSFLRTHPLNAERIADVSNRVETMPYRQVADSLEFNLVKAKLRASNGLAQAAIDQFEDNIKERRFASETAEHYGLALAMLRKNDLAGAQNQVKWLKANSQKYNGQNAFIENLIARLEVARNNPQAAASQYAKGLALFPTHRSLIYGYAEHFLAINQYDKAIKLVHDKQTLYPNDAYFYDILAKAYTAKNKNLLRFQAQGESYYRKYNLKRAIEQMEFATKAKDGNFYEQSIVEARLNELRRLQENEKLAEERLS